MEIRVAKIQQIYGPKFKIQQNYGTKFDKEFCNQNCEMLWPSKTTGLFKL